MGIFFYGVYIFCIGEKIREGDPQVCPYVQISITLREL